MLAEGNTILEIMKNICHFHCLQKMQTIIIFFASKYN